MEAVQTDRHECLADSIAQAVPQLVEIFAEDGSGAATGFCLAHCQGGNGPTLWVQDRRAIGALGRPYPLGLPGALGRELVHVAARDGREALWAMGEGVKCPALGAVIGEIHGDPRALDFTATRRLAVAAERYGVPVLLVRIAGHADLSGARRRWRIASRPSLSHRFDARAPGRPVWSLDLFRARDRRPGQWQAAYDRTAHRLDLAAAAGDGALAQGAPASRP